MPSGELRFFEARFGRPFSGVRIHADPAAAASAKRISARAFTLGNDVVFGEGQYAPGSTDGRRLIAHELTHVIQQSGGGTRIQREDDETWVQDREGNLYYRTREEAERRRRALERRGEWEEYRVTSFERRDQTFWRVEMRGPRAEQAPEPPEGDTEDEAQPPSEEQAPEPPEGDTEDEAQPPSEGPEDVPAEGTEDTPAEESQDAPAQQPTASKKVCLTFDDGPQDPGTEEVLDVLQSRGVVGAFFLTGRNMQSNATRQLALVQRMLNEGHQIGNHTFTHVPATGSQYRSQYGDLSDPTKRRRFRENYENNSQHFESLFRAAGATFPSFTLARLPGQGRFIRFNNVLVYVRETERLGLVHVTWHFEFAPNGAFGHVRQNDWKGVTGVAAEVDRYPRNSDIILFHDRHWGGTNRRRLDNLIGHLAARSFTFGRIDGTGNCA